MAYATDQPVEGNLIAADGTKPHATRLFERSVMSVQFTTLAPSDQSLTPNPIDPGVTPGSEANSLDQGLSSHGQKFDGVVYRAIALMQTLSSLRLKRSTWCSWRTPICRAADPGDIAALVPFLASDSANIITGAVYLIDGARTAH
jgi:NAD(P)-dependent dehydrogenase (short-subunit alcohol dehydrogenase family)